MRCKWLICLEFSPQSHPAPLEGRCRRVFPAHKPHAKCLRWSAMSPVKTANRNTDTEYPQFADPRSVNGMKRDVCAVVPDEPVPAERPRPAVGHGSATSPRETGTSRYEISSICGNTTPRPHPRAHASTPRLSRSSPAIPTRFQSSVQASTPALGM